MAALNFQVSKARRAIGTGGVWCLWWMLSSMVLVACLLPSTVRSADAKAYSEHLVKGVFLTKFALFVEWPESSFAGPKAPVTIGIIGNDPFGPHFESAVQKEVARGRQFQVKRFKTPEEIKDCHILFVSSSGGTSLPAILKATSGRPILIVGDEERFAHRGGMVNFVMEGERLRFEVNPAAVEGSGLKISAKLLQVAKTVRTEISKEGGR